VRACASLEKRDPLPTSVQHSDPLRSAIKHGSLKHVVQTLLANAARLNVRERWLAEKEKELNVREAELDVIASSGGLQVRSLDVLPAEAQARERAKCTAQEAWRWQDSQAAHKACLAVSSHIFSCSCVGLDSMD